MRASVFLLWLVCFAACAGVREEVIDLPVSAASMYGRTYERPIKVVIWRDDGRERSPFLIQAWFAAFKAKGVPGLFVLLPPLAPELEPDGHAMFTRNPSAWRPPFEAFLREQGFLTKGN